MVPSSCDTMVAVPGATRHGQTLFAKNSDRPWDECQPLELHERRAHGTGARHDFQFVSMPQVEVTWRHVGSRPWWCQGYEHGFNEHQVVIGNEGLASRFDPAPEARLIGMEILRLGLERGRTAREAVQAMTDAVGRYGQGKFANDAGVRTYDNGYIVADPTEAFVLETAGHEWAVQAVASALGISNVYSVAEDCHSLSPTAAATAVERGWWPAGEPFRFADAYSAGDRTQGGGAQRRRRSCAVLAQAAGRIEVATMMALLGDHSAAAAPDEPFRTDLTGHGICVHFEAAPQGGGPSGGNTAASLVADLCADGSRLAVYWCSLYSPCLSLFFPVFLEGALPAALAAGGRTPTADSPWWRFQRLAQVAREVPGGVAATRARWAPMQQGLIASAYPLARQARQLLDAGRGEQAEARLTAYMDGAVEAMLAAADELIAQLGAAAVAA